jgi:hypothetical protein
MASSDFNVDLGLIQTLLQKASRDAEAALAATERLYSSVLPQFETISLRLTAMEGRIGGLEQRVTGMERGLDQIARSNHRLETMLADIAGRI